MKANCHATEKRQLNDQAKNGGGGLAMINAENGDFVMHRRFVLTVALKVDDRGGGGEDFTAAAIGEAGGAGGTGGAEKAGGEEVSDIPKCLKKAFILAVSLTFMTSNLALNSRDCLTKALSTAVAIVAFNS